MTYIIKSNTHKEEYNVPDNMLTMLKMKTANLADVRDEVVQLIDGDGNVIQTSFPLFVKNEDYKMLVNGYKNN